MSYLNLTDLAAMYYTDFQRIIDEERKISSFQWFKNSNVFCGLREEARNVIYDMEA